MARDHRRKCCYHQEARLRKNGLLTTLSGRSMANTDAPDHTHTHQTFKLRYGHPLPFGASHIPGGLNFSIFSTNATACTLVLFRKGEPTPFAEIPFPDEYRLGHVWSMAILDLDYEEIEYGYRFDGPYDPHQGVLFDPSKILLDPYAREISGMEKWR